MATNTEIQWIPLRDLELSDRNARTTPASADSLRELEASLQAVGLLENLVVRAAGKRFHVVAGGRRLHALQNIAKKRNGRFRPATPIPCRLIPDDAIDEEVSLVENAVRVNMHPIDQFTTFHRLLEHGRTAREIARRFGVTVRTVQRRLRLGGVAPDILADARTDGLTLDQLEAFAATPDRTRQLDVWNKMRNHGAYTPSAGWIRAELQRDLLSGASPRVRFVGLKAYKAAGGTVEEDLFAAQDDRSIHVCDVALLNDLASKKLQAATRELEPGWRWVDTMLETDWDVTRQFGRLKGKPEPPTAAEQERYTALTKEIDDLKEHLYTLEDTPENAAERERVSGRIGTLDAEAHALDTAMHARQSYTAEQKACAGCIVTIDADGALLIHQGLVRRQDEHLVPTPAAAAAATHEPAPAPTANAPAEPHNPDAEATPAANPAPQPGQAEAEAHPARTPGPDPGSAEPPPPPGDDYRPPQYEASEPDETAAATREARLRLNLAEDLRLIRTAIVKAHLASDFDLAFDVAAYQMATAVFGDTRRGPTTIDINPTTDSPAAGDPRANESLAEGNPGARMLAASAANLPLDWLNQPAAAERFREFRDLGAKDKRGLFAAAVARALMPQLAFDPKGQPETETIVGALDIPFHRLYRPDLDGFWRRMGRREMLAIAAETLDEDWSDAHASDRKDTLAQAMAAAFGPDTPPAALGITGEARARALEWAPPGFEAAIEAQPPSAPGTNATEPARDLPAWMQG